MYAGLYARELQLSQSVDKGMTGNLDFDRANKARVVECVSQPPCCPLPPPPAFSNGRTADGRLAKERQMILKEREAINHKIVLAEKRMALEKAQAQ